MRISRKISKYMARTGKVKTFLRMQEKEATIKGQTALASSYLRDLREVKKNPQIAKSNYYNFLD